MSVTFLILEQTIIYLHRRCSSELQIFILIFQKKKNRGGFLFGMKTCKSKLSSQWLSLARSSASIFRTSRTTTLDHARTCHDMSGRVYIFNLYEHPDMSERGLGELRFLTSKNTRTCRPGVV